MQVQSLGWEDPLEKGMAGNPLQYSFLEKPMDRGAWRATAWGVTKSQTQLKRLSTHKQARHSAQLLCWNLCPKKYSFSISLVKFVEMTKAT